MNKGLKIIGVIMSLLLLSVFLAIALINAPYIMPEQLERFRFFTLTNYYMQQYIFWAAVVFAVLAIIILLVVLFYPKSRGTFVMKREDGKLTIDEKSNPYPCQRRLETNFFISRENRCIDARYRRRSN